MGMQFKSGVCKSYGESRKVERKTANHILHLILSILTFKRFSIYW